LNRFYTEEFFREASVKLNPGGVLSFQVTGAENYISRELAELLSCLEKTLRAVFPQVIAIPGETVHFLATHQPGSLTRDPSVLIARLHARGIHTQYFREYYIPFQMSPDRMLDLETQIEPRAATPVNRDFTPVGYYFDVVLWSSRFQSHWRDLIEALARLRFAAIAGSVSFVWAALTLLVGYYEHRKIARQSTNREMTPLQSELSSRQNRPGKPPLQPHRATLGLAVAAMGFTLLGLEVLLLLGFQALYGYVYQQLAVLVALFMVGMAAGAWLALRDDRQSSGTAATLGYAKLAALQLMAAAAPLLLYEVFVLLSRVRTSPALLAASPLIFPVLALLAGLLGGHQFPLASRLYWPRTRQEQSAAWSHPGMLYGLDLLGACWGAAALSAYLLPVYGFLRTALLMAVMNLGPAALTALAASAAWVRQRKGLSGPSVRRTPAP